jgi:Fe2+ or Zn2+ uptake regulation protein
VIIPNKYQHFKETDPELFRSIREEANRRQREKWTSDPERRKRKLKNAAEWRAKNHEYIKAQSKLDYERERIDPEFKKRRIERNRQARIKQKAKQQELLKVVVEANRVLSIHKHLRSLANANQNAERTDEAVHNLDNNAGPQPRASTQASSNDRHRACDEPLNRLAEARGREDGECKMTPLQQKIVDEVNKGGGQYSAYEIASWFDETPSKIMYNLQKLRKKGVLQYIKGGGPHPDTVTKAAAPEPDNLLQRIISLEKRVHELTISETGPVEGEVGIYRLRSGEYTYRTKEELSETAYASIEQAKSALIRTLL